MLNMQNSLNVDDLKNVLKISLESFQCQGHAWHAGLAATRLGYFPCDELRSLVATGLDEIS